MQNFSFSEYLITGLVLLLFGRDYLPAILSKFGIKTNAKNGNNYQPQIDELKEHTKIANEEMGSVKEKLDILEISVAKIETKLDIILKHYDT